MSSIPAQLQNQMHLPEIVEISSPTKSHLHFAFAMKELSAKESLARSPQKKAGEERHQKIQLVRRLNNKTYSLGVIKGFR